MEAIEKIEHKGKTIEIHIDEDATSPRENDNLGTILYVSGHYILGDKKVSPKEIAAIEARDDVIMLPVYAYIHSGIALNTTGFSSHWDSGQCGIIYADRESILKWFNAKKLTKALREKVKECLRAEIEEFGKYLGGEVYGYEIKDSAGEIVDSCWGFIGMEWVIQTAKEAC